MFATSEGTARYAERFPGYRDAGFYRTVQGLAVSSLGIGTYLGAGDDATDAAYIDALVAAGEGGINLFDTAINYRGQRSERCAGAALARLQRDEIVVCTKAGFLTPGAVPPSLKPEQVVGRMHSLEPDFLVHQAECSRVNLGVDTIDVLYLHNPETQLGFVTPGELEERLRRAFRCLEEMAEAERVRWYGVATWDGFRIGALSVERLAVLATEECGHGHRFRFLQLPFNLGMVEAFAGGTVSVLETAARLGINVIASATLAQTQALSHIPESVAGALPGLTNAQRAIQFTRSTPGIGAALVGMARREHVIENLGVAAVAPFARDEYLRFYR